jgi:hypothetical protein
MPMYSVAMPIYACAWPGVTQREREREGERERERERVY